MNPQNNWKPLIYALLIALGIAVGMVLKPSGNGFLGAVGSKDKLSEILQIIKQSYVDEVDIDSLEEAGINSILTSLDPHSVYIPAKELAVANEQLEGNFEGIGVEFNIFNDTIMVVTPLSGGPSAELGIMAGDRIIAVDTINVAGNGITNEKVFKLLRGPKGSVVNVKIYRPSTKSIISFAITRNTIPIFSIDANFMLNSKTGYIKISRFADKTHNEFLEAFNELNSFNMENLILDLRGNPGGYLHTATLIADELLDNKKLIVYTEGRTKPRTESFASKKGVFEQGKLIVLIDEGTASASEIVSGAVQDWDRGIIVGRRSFGKGLVQEPYELKDGSAIRLTVSRYYTPSGRCIQKDYKNGKDYNHDLIDRYTNGELESEEKTTIFDSTPYATKILGRRVYGGGGIYPDVFVPIDTTYYSAFLTAVVGKSLIGKFAYRFLDKNRTFISKNFTIETFTNSFSLTDDEYNEFLKFAAEEGIVPQYKHETVKSKDFILIQIKALIARQLYRDKGYYMVMKQHDRTIQKALEVLNNYNAILK
jgi:carboxyl-terminal processing protease